VKQASIDLSRLAQKSKEMIESMTRELESPNPETETSGDRWPTRFISAGAKPAPQRWGARFIAVGVKHAPRWGTRFLAAGPKSAPRRS